MLTWKTRQMSFRWRSSFRTSSPFIALAAARKCSMRPRLKECSSFKIRECQIHALRETSLCKNSYPTTIESTETIRLRILLRSIRLSQVLLPSRANLRSNTTRRSSSRRPRVVIIFSNHNEPVRIPLKTSSVEVSSIKLQMTILK